MFSNLRVFRDPIKPLWEVPQNREGGKFVIILNRSEAEMKIGASGFADSSAAKSESSSATKDEESDEDTQRSNPSEYVYDKPPVEVPVEFKLCLSLMVLGLFGPVEQFCGCVLSIRAFGFMISIWVSSSTDDNVVNILRQTIAELMHLPIESISFQRHSQTIRNNTRSLSKTEVRKRMREARARGDHIEPPAPAKPPRRKSESEKPLFHPSASEGYHHPNNNAQTSSNANQASRPGSSSQPSPSEGQSKRSRGIHRSVSGEGLGYASTSTQAHSPSHGSSQSNHHGHQGAHSNNHGHHQQQNRSPTSPRTGGGQSQPSSSSSQSPSHSQQQQQGSSGPNSPNDQPTWRELAAQNKSGPKRTAAFSRSSNVHFGESVSVQTYTQDGAPSQKGSSAQAKVHPPAPFNIPDINIMSGTPPASSHMMAMAAAHGHGQESGKSGVSVSRPSPSSSGTSTQGQGNFDESEWIPAGGNRAHSNGGGHNSHSNSGAHHQPFTSPRGYGQSQSGNAKKNAAAKRRTQSASAGGQNKPDPNYISPEALFGADLPLLSPGGTPMTSVPSSPPAELDEEDLNLLEAERRQRKHHPSETDMANHLSAKIAKLSLQNAQASSSGVPSSDDTLASPTSPTASSSSSGNTSARRRQKNQNRRNSSNDS